MNKKDELTPYQRVYLYNHSMLQPPKPFGPSFWDTQRQNQKIIGNVLKHGGTFNYYTK